MKLVYEVMRKAEMCVRTAISQLCAFYVRHRLVLNFYVSVAQMTLRHEDGDDEAQLPPSGRKDRRRASVGGANERRGLERRRSRRHSLQSSKGHASAPASPSSPHTPSGSFLPFNGQRVEDISER